MKLNSALSVLFSVLLPFNPFRQIDRTKDFIVSIYDIQCNADNKGM